MPFVEALHGVNLGYAIPVRYADVLGVGVVLLEEALGMVSDPDPGVGYFFCARSLAW